MKFYYALAVLFVASGYAAAEDARQLKNLEQFLAGNPNGAFGNLGYEKQEAPMCKGKPVEFEKRVTIAAKRPKKAKVGTKLSFRKKAR